MTIPTRIAAAVSMVWLVPLAALAADDHEALSASCEEALALSALPARLRANAAVYTLTDHGFKLTRDADGPFTCIVERNHKKSIIPQCADAEGAETVIPAIMQRTEWALAGVPLEERQARFSRKAKTGEYLAPRRPGINYMMSDFNFVWNAESESMMHIPAHVMFYAPNLSNDDVGGSMQEAMAGNRGTPFIIEEGIHGYMTSFVEHASDSSDVLAACEGQLSAISESPSNSQS